MQDVKDFLKDIRAEMGIIEAMKQEEALLCDSLLPRGISYDGISVQTSPSDRTAGVMAAAVDLAKQRAAHREKLLKDIFLAQELLGKMPTKEYALLLRMRYLGGEGPYTKWAYIASCMGYSENYCRCRLHGFALEEARPIWRKMRQNVTFDCDTI